jgi:hypothetical protein
MTWDTAVTVVWWIWLAAIGCLGAVVLLICAVGFILLVHSMLFEDKPRI